MCKHNLSETTVLSQAVAKYLQYLGYQVLNLLLKIKLIHTYAFPFSTVCLTNFNLQSCLSISSGKPEGFTVQMTSSEMVCVQPEHKKHMRHIETK